MEQQVIQTEPMIEARIERRIVSPRLRKITGWALLAASAGTFFDAYASSRGAQGSIGLIPLYLGFPIGSIGFVILIRQVAGWTPAILAAIGLAPFFYFMGAYPNGAEGWIGLVLFGIAHLFLPLIERFPAVLWITAGLLGFPEFGQGSWGLLSAFTIFGAAIAASGIFILWDYEQKQPHEPLSNTNTGAGG
jgi:hypothetical protein